MKTATILFTYNRSYHTKKVLDALAENTALPERLFIFQDGMKEGQKNDEWLNVKEVIHKVDFCPVEIVESECNKGLAKSVIDGINYVLQFYDAVIVLEDDCVPAPGFMSFMLQCFEKYQDNKEIFSVSGYGWPIDVEIDEYDVYFTGRISSWGWGTWKDRWKQYEADNDILDKLKYDKEKSIDLAMWGNDLTKMLYDRIAGKNDSWAVYWALKVIEQKGLCLAPYVSLIQNIGCDGSGTNCGINDRFTVEMDDTRKTQYILPDHINFRQEIISAFASVCGSHTAINSDVSKKKILVYGLGEYFKINEDYINQMYYIEAFIDRAKDGYYAGKRILKLSQINEYQYDAVIIMMQNIQECIKIAKMLKQEMNIPANKILIGGAVQL